MQQSVVPPDLDEANFTLARLGEDIVVYVVPWAIVKTLQGGVAIDTNHSYSTHPHGTEHVRVMRQSGEYLVDASTVSFDQMTKSSTHPPSQFQPARLVDNFPSAPMPELESQTYFTIPWAVTADPQSGALWLNIGEDYYIEEFGTSHLAFRVVKEKNGPEYALVLRSSFRNHKVHRLRPHDRCLPVILVDSFED